MSQSSAPAPPGDEGGLRDAVTRRHRRTSLLLAAGVEAALSVAEPLYRPVGAEFLVLHGAWVVLLVAGALLVGRGSGRQIDVFLPLLAAANVLFFWAGVVLTGGLHSPDFRYAAVLPLALAVVFQDELVATLAGSLTMVACVASVRGAGDSEWADAFASTAAMGALAAFGSWSFRRLRLAERAHQRSRTEALERLALSEQRRTQVERLALLGQLSAGVAHEISSPLAYVSANIRVLAEAVSQPSPTLDLEEMRSLLRDVEHGSARIRQIVGDLKGYARGESAGDEECAVEDIIADALRLASMKIGRTVEVRRVGSTELPPVRVNRRKLSQVLINLLVNAADALTSPPVPSPSITVSAYVDGPEVCVAVQDNGPGIAPHIAARLFQPFATTKPVGVGTGLGLALAREYAAEFGGRLELEPCAQGARFALRLPPVRR